MSPQEPKRDETSTSLMPAPSYSACQMVVIFATTHKGLELMNAGIDRIFDK